MVERQIEPLGKGGYAKEQSLFIMHEREPELVGRISGNSVLMKNREALIDAVAKAVGRALYDGTADKVADC